MNVNRAASIPLITHDPFFSVWSSSDKLYEDDTRHWSQNLLRMFGSLEVEGKEYSFLGKSDDKEPLTQVFLEVTAMTTRYLFENDQVRFRVQFTSPLLPDDLKVFSRPCTYIQFSAEKKKDVRTVVRLELTSDFVKNSPGPVYGGVHEWNLPEQETFSYGYMYKGNQHILGYIGDNNTIDWGNIYLAIRKEEGELAFRQEQERLVAEVPLENHQTKTIIAAFDDILSINYLGDAKRGYWKKYYRNLPEVIGACFGEEQKVLERCAEFDQDIEEKAEKSGGKEYVFLCNMSYRQVMAGHKLISDSNGEPIFLSKECGSNGCIGTVDVSYPSVPLFLCYSTELAKGMLRPIFEFADLPVWNYDFAPHDLGRYPYATGQVYGLFQKKQGIEYLDGEDVIFPFFADLPDGKEIYDIDFQMPVEESGNMLLMTAAVCCMENSVEFAAPYMPMLKKWVNYLIQYGKDPDEQLCTDDFAGHLCHNVNLSAKAIMGIEAYAQILRLQKDEEGYTKYHFIAKEYAAYWEKHAVERNHTLLSYDKPETWSLKYNIIWDRFFKSNLFTEAVFEREAAFYIQKCKQYGTPLDSRATYTKSDWILWCSAMTDDMESRKALIDPVADFLKETSSRVPFSDWYDTETGEYYRFKGRTVQGGIFMPILIDCFVNNQVALTRPGSVKG